MSEDFNCSYSINSDGVTVTSENTGVITKVYCKLNTGTLVMITDDGANVSQLNMTNFTCCAEGTVNIKLEQTDLSPPSYNGEPIYFDDEVTLSVKFH